mmetsp:Transcript_43717/g.131041  ORF Transcript_43717/g.131041 Transcript_43717/m.131041 type:complete len:215 (+) Transcript_43717:223-867(+)
MVNLLPPHISSTNDALNQHSARCSSLTVGRLAVSSLTVNRLAVSRLTVRRLAVSMLTVRRLAVSRLVVSRLTVSRLAAYEPVTAGTPILTGSGRHPPVNLLARPHRHHHRRAKCVLQRDAAAHALQGDGVGVAREAVKVGAVVRRECLEAVQRAGAFEDGRVERQADGRGKHAGAAACGLLGALWVWRAVRPEEELLAAARDGGGHCLAVALAL